jgi:hypothetical protein
MGENAGSGMLVSVQAAMADHQVGGRGLKTDPRSLCTDCVPFSARCLMNRAKGRE